jgi:cytochrome c oxidase cbb3-type subunit 3
MPSTTIAMHTREFLAGLFMAVASLSPLAVSSAADTQSLPATDTTADSGRKVYEFYCYQCHGYSGDARTLASTYLNPPPRNFSVTDPEVLTRERMIRSVSTGRDGTAMTAFSSVLNSDEISAVVGYIRSNFMQGTRPALIYHTPENGWERHERYRDAFPFANGDIALDTPWEELSAQQQRGKQLFMQACISCHDRSRVNNEGPIWELRALSWPRKHYTHTAPVDATSGASPYALHDRPPAANNLTASQQRGERLYQENCAFCHAADGSARNWIGSFMQPRPRDLTGRRVTGMDIEQLETVIMDGIDGTSMPAWRHVLDERQVTDIIEYIQRVFTEAGSTAVP